MGYEVFEKDKVVMTIREAKEAYPNKHIYMVLEDNFSGTMNDFDNQEGTVVAVEDLDISNKDYKELRKYLDNVNRSYGDDYSIWYIPGNKQEGEKC